MKAQLNIEFADRLGNVGRLAALVALSLAVATGTVIWDWQTTRFELAEAKDKLDQALLSDRARDLRAREAQRQLKENPARIVAVNNAITALNVPWAATLKETLNKSELS